MSFLCELIVTVLFSFASAAIYYSRFIYWVIGFHIYILIYISRILDFKLAYRGPQVCQRYWLVLSTLFLIKYFYLSIYLLVGLPVSFRFPASFLWFSRSFFIWRHMTRAVFSLPASCWRLTSFCWSLADFSSTLKHLTKVNTM